MENIGIIELRKKLLSGEITVTEAVNYYFSRIEEKDGELNAFITLNKEIALKQAKEYDDNPTLLKEKKLGGVPIAIKDVFTTDGLRTTCASMILDDYVPVYNATVVQKVIDAGAIIIGKTNLDEFCHGSSTTTSAYGPSRNPWDLTKLPGGSSGGSATAIAADLCTVALGTETAGSVRLPASWCGLIGFKPTYGRVSRYGVLAMGSSLDSPGPMVRKVEDAALMMEVLAGHDENDFTTQKVGVSDYVKDLDINRIKGLKVGVPKEYMELDLSDGVRENTQKAIEVLKELGAEIVEVNILDPKYSIATYTLVCRSEVSSNLARYDSTRYGISDGKKDTSMQYIEDSRGKGFGEEAKRRVMTGTFALSAGYSDEYYKKAEKVRQLMTENILGILDKVDVIIGPTTPTTALTDEDAENNPLFGEMADVLAEASSLGGLPGVSVPSGLSEGMPTGLNIVSRHFEEQLILDVALAYQNATDKLVYPR